MTTSPKRFRVALSYASASPERFAYVHQVADRLAEAFGGPTQILYDEFHEAELSRPDLDEHLLPLYRDHSDLMVVFLDEHYERSQWCGLEWRVVRALIKQRKPSTVMLLRFDATDPEALLGLAGFLDIRGRPAEEIASLVVKRWQQETDGAPAGPSAPALAPRAPKAALPTAHAPEPEPKQNARIGILTALPKECAAMCSLLTDESQYTAPGEGGGRTYYLGKIPAVDGGSHAVVVGLLPDMGNNSAAISATRLRQHFPSVKHIIMCGIAGGVPRPGDPEHDVRLGDIVVSDRNGVVQYDLVKERPDGSREHRHPPRPPSAELLEAVRHLRMDEERDRRPWEAFLRVGDESSKWKRPGDHVDAQGAEIAYPPDPERKPGLPRVFHSMIAAANALLKNPAHRDYLATMFGVKAVEMEGSGVADATWVDEAGYLVVRGICDYCDEKKGDVWHRAAALAAAAYVRALISWLPGGGRAAGNELGGARGAGGGAGAGRKEQSGAAGPSGAPLSEPERPTAPPAEVAAPLVPPRIRLDGLRTDAVRIFGREQEIAQLDAAWAETGPGKANIVVFVAAGGVGKTSLVTEWINRLRDAGWRGAELVCSHSFYSQGVRDQGAAFADAFVNTALEFFGDPEVAKSGAGPEDKGTRLAELVGQQRAVLVLDGIEPLQQPPRKGVYAGELKDRALAALLRGLAHHNRGLCVLTTRESVHDLRALGSTVRERNLDQLSQEAGGALLEFLLAHEQFHGPPIPSTETERAEIWKAVQGHAFTLQLLGRYLRRRRWDVRRWTLVRFEAADTTGHAFRMLDAYERWLAGEDGEPTPGGQRMLAVLRILGLFDRAADPGCIGALCEGEAIAGLTEPLVRLDEGDWVEVLADLEALGLVSREAWEPLRIEGFGEAQTNLRTGETTGAPEVTVMPGWSRLSESLDAHPLVREHFGRRVKAASEAAWKEGHRRVFEHLCGSTPYWPEGMQGLGPLYQAVAHGCQAGAMEQAYEVFRSRIYRGTSHGGIYSKKKLGLLGADLGAVAWFFESPWSRPSPDLDEGTQAWLLHEAAFSLRAIGCLTEAAEVMRTGLDKAVKQGDWRQSTTTAASLSELELVRGEIVEALHVAEQSIDFADRSTDAFLKMATRTNHAEALHQAGHRDRAQKEFEEAEAMQVNREPWVPRLYSIGGFRYCDLLLFQAEHAAWRVTMGCDKSTSSDAPVGKIRSSASNNTTAYYRALVACDEVIARATEAMRVAAINGVLLGLGLAHLSLGCASLYQALLSAHDPARPEDRHSHASGALTTAKLHLHAAAEHFRDSREAIWITRGLLTSAWLHHRLADPTASKADLDEAESLATRGPMPIFLADVHLTRARLFRDRAELGKAHELLLDLRARGYHRHDVMLSDTEHAASTWPEATP